MTALAVVCLCGMTSACGTTTDPGPTAEQKKWADTLRATLDAKPSDCVAVGPSCSGFITALDQQMTALDSVVQSWDAPDRFPYVRADAATTHEKAKDFHDQGCVRMPMTDRKSSDCAFDLSDAMKAVSDTKDRLTTQGRA